MNDAEQEVEMPSTPRGFGLPSVKVEGRNKTPEKLSVEVQLAIVRQNLEEVKRITAQTKVLLGFTAILLAISSGLLIWKYLIA